MFVVDEFRQIVYDVGFMYVVFPICNSTSSDEQRRSIYGCVDTVYSLYEHGLWSNVFGGAERFFGVDVWFCDVEFGSEVVFGRWINIDVEFGLWTNGPAIHGIVVGFYESGEDVGRRVDIVHDDIAEWIVQECGLRRELDVCSGCVVCILCSVV